MKKHVILAVFLVLLVATGLTGCFLREPDVGAFDLNEYRPYLESFPYEGNVGAVADADFAIKAADSVWSQAYGDMSGEKPYRVFYDAEEGVWLVTGSLPANAVGGVAHILIKEATGDVLAVWHDK